MKVKVEIIIDADRDTVWGQLDRAGDQQLWQPTTVTEKRKPDFLAGVYEGDAVKAIVVNHFEVIDGGRTRWLVYANHQFSGMMKLRSLFSPGAVRKRTEDDMQRFKLLVESRLAEESP